MHNVEIEKSKLLIIAQWYTPGFKAGGPIRSIQNLVDLLKEDFDIYVFTSDRDHRDANPFENIELNHWIKPNGHSVFYADKSHLTLSFLKNMLRHVNPDAVFFEQHVCLPVLLVAVNCIKTIRI